MAIEELNKKIEKEETERRKRYPLLDIVNNRAEIRSISEDALKYCVDVYPELKALHEQNLWEIVPRITIELLKEVFSFVAEKKSKESGEISYDLGEFLKVGIEYGTTDDAEKEGTFNPIISVKSEMYFDNVIDVNNKVPSEKADFGDSVTLQEICTKVTDTLMSKFGIKVSHYTAILNLFASFMRMTKQYLIKHRDDTEYGVEINLADVVDLSIEKYIGDSGDEYCIQIAPGQIAKLQFAKNDDVTENGGTDNSGK